MRESFIPGCHRLPVVLEPPTAGGAGLDELCAWIDTRRDYLDGRLLEAGAVLLRGFAVVRAQDFERVAQAFSPQLAAYVEGQSQRERVHGNVYTSTSYPARERVTIHNELSYAARPPAHLMFFCRVAPTDGGQTPVLDCRSVLDVLAPDVVAQFRDRGVLYVKNMHGGGPGMRFGKSWQEHFETTERATVERYLEDSGVQFEWRGDTLHTRQVRPGTLPHPRTGELAWFNQASLWHVSNLGAVGQQMLRTLGEQALPTHAYFGDGSPMDAGMLDHVRDTTWQHASHFAWQAGDVLLLDNHLAAHGRAPFSGPREILAALA